MILIVVKWTIRPEYADSWMERVAEFTASTRAEPGNLFFEWNRSVEDPHVYTLVEGFRDDAAEALRAAGLSPVTDGPLPADDETTIRARLAAA